MSEIKFRAWNAPEKHMVFSKPMPDMGFWKWVAYDDTTPFMRHTGLRDKNGVEIYEGDIVESVAFKDYVIFADGMFTLRRSGKSVNISNFTTEKQYQPLHWLEPVEVIGNIYENPDLLTQEETTHGN